jgi:hypothetical protein
MNRNDVIHPEALDETRRKLLDKLAALEPVRRFYLAGGTGLALAAGHRRSLDFDFFRESPKGDLPDVGGLKRVLAGLEEEKIQREEEGTLHVEIGGIRMSFLAYAHRLLKKPYEWKGLAIANPVDIGLMKLAAIIQRGSKRDFIDLDCIIRRYASLDALISLVSVKFPDVHDFAIQASRALVYFADADKQRDPDMLETGFSWNAVKMRIEDETRKVFRKTLKGVA